MLGFDAISPARWSALATGRAGPPSAAEWPIVAIALVLVAFVAGLLLRAVGLSTLEAALVALMAPLVVLVNVPLGEDDGGARILANMAGCLIPFAVALMVILTRRTHLALGIALIAVSIALGFVCSRVVPTRGVLLDYQTSALGTGLLAGALMRSAPRLAGAWAFSAAAIGTIIGADLLHLGELLQTPAVATITLGGAGLLDGILLTAVLSSFVAATTAWTVQLAAKHRASQVIEVQA